MTQEQFSQNYGRIAMPKPFAHGGLITPIADIGDSTHPVNFEDGFPSQYSSPHSLGGKYVSRGEFNAIGNLATRNDFYRMCGGLNVFDANFCIKIGGYPKGAVLQILNQGALWYVESLKDNNKVDFTGTIPTQEQSAAGITMGSVDGVNWRYCYESKYVEEGESFVEHVENNVMFTPINSIPYYQKRAPRDGIVAIRNVAVENLEEKTFGPYVQVTSHVSWGQQCGAIIGKSIEASMVSEVTALTPYDTSEHANTFTSLHRLDIRQPLSVTSTFISATQTAINWNFSTNWMVKEGLFSVNQGDYIFLFVIPNITESSFGNKDVAHIGYNAKISLDIYII